MAMFEFPHKNQSTPWPSRSVIVGCNVVQTSRRREPRPFELTDSFAYDNQCAGSEDQYEQGNDRVDGQGVWPLGKWPSLVHRQSDDEAYETADYQKTTNALDPPAA
jgi:hypothetical protein